MLPGGDHGSSSIVMNELVAKSTVKEFIGNSFSKLELDTANDDAFANTGVRARGGQRYIDRDHIYFKKSLELMSLERYSMFHAPAQLVHHHS